MADESMPLLSSRRRIPRSQISHSTGQTLPTNVIIGGLLFGLVAASVLAITFGVKWGNERAVQPTYAKAFNGCLYGSPKILEIQSRTIQFLKDAYGSGGFTTAIFDTFAKFDPTVFAKLYTYTTEDDALANFPTFKNAVELQKFALDTYNDTSLGELERVGISFVIAETTNWINNTRINWYHNSYGSAFFGVSWDVHLLELWSVTALLAPEFASEPDFASKMNAWLENYIQVIPTWTAYYQAQVDSPNPHVHANVTIAQWSADWRFFANPGDFALYVCSLMSGSDQTTCEANAAIADTLNAEFLDLWDGAYGSAAASIRPDATPGLGFAHQGNLSYSYWVKYHTELDISPAEIEAEGLANVAATQNNINAAMQRLDPPQTLADYIIRSSNCTDPDFTVAGGLDNCTENPLGDDVCHRPFLDQIWARFGQILSYVPEIDGYLGRNSYLHRTDGTDGTYTSNGAYDPERSLYLSPSYINWGRKCVDDNGIVRFSSPLLSTTTLIHEGVPGHQSQIPLQVELTCQITNLTASTAWFEGWGLWSEGLGFIMNASVDQPLGLYQNPLAEAGRWEANLLRTVRLVVDPRLHSLGNMSYLDCVNYFDALGLTASTGLYECSRYITMPAQADAYWLGKKQFDILANDAQTRLGSDFDYREFLLIVSKFGGLGLFSDFAKLVNTYILWKQRDPAAITSFGYNFFLNDFYRQAAPIVAKGGKDIASRTAIPPGAKKRITTAKKSMASMEGTKAAPIMYRNNYKMKHRAALSKKAQHQPSIRGASAKARAEYAKSILRTKNARRVAKQHTRTTTLEDAMKRFSLPAKMVKLK